MSIPRNTQILTKHIVDIHNQIHQINQKLHALREQKKQIEISLVNNLQSNQLTKQAINYQGHKVYLGRETNYDSLTFKFLEECLNKLFLNRPQQVKQIITFIKQQRHKQTQSVIKIRGGGGQS